MGDSVLKRIGARSPLTITLLFGCTGDPGGVPDDLFASHFTGLVLEYTDNTRTATRAVVGARVEVLLPDGVTEEYCDADYAFGPVTCRQVQFVEVAFPGPDGQFWLTVDNPAHCALRLRAWERNIGVAGSGHGEGKTATLPVLGTPCENNGIQAVLSLIVE